MSYFSDAPVGTVQRMLYDDKIVRSPIRITNDVSTVRSMANGELPPNTGMVREMGPWLRDPDFWLHRAMLAISRNLRPTFSYYSCAVLAGIYKPLKHLFPCQIATLDQDFREIGNGMVFRKGWPYTKILNYYFLEVNAFRISEILN